MFFIGLIIGGFVVLVIMSAIQVNRENNYIDLVEDVNGFNNYAKGTIKKEERLGTNLQYVLGMKDVANMYEKFFKEELE